MHHRQKSFTPWPCASGPNLDVPERRKADPEAAERNEGAPPSRHALSPAGKRLQHRSARSVSRARKHVRSRGPEVRGNKAKGAIPPARKTMRSPRFLITGATGNTGREAVELLLERGHQVRAFVHQEDDHSAHL